jgi:predicted PurR-regulated permease PerM
MNDPNDPLELALRETPYLEDGGFADGVMRALPPRREGRREKVLLVASVVAALVGAVTLGEAAIAVALALGAGGAAGFLILGAAAAAAAGVLIRE